MKKYLVTGGAGFIGRNFISYLFKKYDRAVKVINLDKLTYAGNPDNMLEFKDRPEFEFVKGDICDAALVEKIMPGIDIVVNFAAESHVDRSIGSPDDFIKTDIFGAFVLLEAARKNNVEKFIQISTDEVYGSIIKGSFKETDTLEPSSPYSASKAGADRLAYSYFVTFQLPVIITRCSNNFGPFQYPEKLISLFVTNAIENKTLPIYGKGENVRDWIYVLDHCDAIDFLIQAGENGQIYNIGGGNERTNLEITDLILETLNKPAGLKKYVGDRPGHDFRYSVDTEKLRRLGWTPKHEFTEAMEETIEWYNQNSWWWKKIKSGDFLKYYKQQYQTEL
ncbi:dTDP-glucose 4,6-dehydratase [candidate division KSB1 bacterium]|nr:dTDP-glucose 4,6-dehydratase [candidate division KSB1 bacterium]